MKPLAVANCHLAWIAPDFQFAKPGLANDATEDRAEFVGLVKKLRGGEWAAAGEAEVAPVNRDR